MKTYSKTLLEWADDLSIWMEFCVLALMLTAFLTIIGGVVVPLFGWEVGVYFFTVSLIALATAAFFAFAHVIDWAFARFIYPKLPYRWQ